MNVALALPTLVRTSLRSAVFMMALGASAAWAAPPETAFDVVTLVSCRDVTRAEFAWLHPEEKIIEATFRVSLLVNHGRDEDLDELLVVIRSPRGRLPVTDLFPRSEAASEIHGPIITKDSIERNIGGQIGVGSEVAAPWLGPAGQLAPSASVNIGRKTTHSEEYQRLPQTSAVVASGTTERGHGAFFKLRRWAQQPLEGQREYTCWFRVPVQWRADWIELSCQVSGHDRNLLGDRVVSCGEARVLVGLHMAGDEIALHAAQRLERLSRQDAETKPSTSHQARSPGGLWAFFTADGPASCMASGAERRNSSMDQALAALDRLSGAY